MSPQVSHYPRNRPEFKIELARKLGLGEQPERDNVKLGNQIIRA